MAILGFSFFFFLGKRINDKKNRFVQNILSSENEELSLKLNRTNNRISIIQDSILNLKSKLFKYHNWHPYGIGFGMLTIYSTCETCEEKVFVNDTYWGSLTQYFPNGINCMEEYTLYRAVPAGNVHIKATDRINGNRWDFMITVPEDSCISVPLVLKK